MGQNATKLNLINNLGRGLSRGTSSFTMNRFQSRVSRVVEMHAEIKNFKFDNINLEPAIEILMGAKDAELIMDRIKVFSDAAVELQMAVKGHEQDACGGAGMQVLCSWAFVQAQVRLGDTKLLTVEELDLIHYLAKQTLKDSVMTQRFQYFGTALTVLHKRDIGS